MSPITGIDHVAITVSDIDSSSAFYERLLGTCTILERMIEGRVAVRQVAIGGAALSLHQVGHGLTLVAGQPSVGAADVCFRWEGVIEDAVLMLHRAGVPIIDGPAKRRAADGTPSHSVYFRDPDGNLIELMAPISRS